MEHLPPLIVTRSQGQNSDFFEDLIFNSAAEDWHFDIKMGMAVITHVDGVQLTFWWGGRSLLMIGQEDWETTYHIRHWISGRLLSMFPLSVRLVP